MANKNIKLVLTYDGSRYQGWQRQQYGSTIQGILEEKIQMMVGEPVRLIASGRTDAGVHAVNQVSNFITPSDLPPMTIQKGLNSLLPEDIFVKEVQYVPLGFHSRYSAKSKTYEYRILNQEYPDIFNRHFVWHIRPPLEIREMEKCSSTLVGRHDFSTFRSSGSKCLTSIRHVMRAELKNSQNHLLRFVIEADGFLRHMVRNIMGTLVQVGLGKMDLEKFKEVFGSKDRRLAGIKAPPQGLFLMHVEY